MKTLNKKELNVVRELIGFADECWGEIIKRIEENGIPKEDFESEFEALRKKVFG